MTPTKTGSKYHGLYRCLRERTDASLVMTFREVEACLAEPLPASARAARAFWSNRTRTGLQASAWLDAGYRVAEVDLAAETVTFARRTVRYDVRRGAGGILWDPALIRALREHLGVNQAGLAEVLGVRQQTVSEWERGTYAPTRATAKHLTLVAERAGFDLERK